MWQCHLPNKLDFKRGGFCPQDVLPSQMAKHITEVMATQLGISSQRELLGLRLEPRPAHL